MPSPHHCCAPQCANVRDPFDKTLKFHRIPADPDVRREWIARINRKDLRVGDVTPNTRLCSKHFYDGCKTEDHPLPIYFAHKTYPVGQKQPRPRSDSPSGRPGKRRREADAVDALLSLGEDRGSRLEEGKAGVDGSCAPSPVVDSHLPSPSVDNTPIATTACAQATTNCAATVTAVDHVEDGAERVRGKSCAVTTCDNC